MYALSLKRREARQFQIIAAVVTSAYDRAPDLQAIRVASWGGMLSDGREYLLSAWWIATFPGVILMLTALSFNRLGDWVRDLSDPRLRRME